MGPTGRHRAAPGQRRRRGARQRLYGGIAVAVTGAVIGFRLLVSTGAPVAGPVLATPTIPTVVPLPPAQTVVPGRALQPRPTPVTIAVTGSGQFDVVPVGDDATERDVSIHYTVEVEEGLPFAPARIAEVVDQTLTDPRGWTTELGATFARVSEDADVRVLIASPGTTDELCAPLETRGRVSCRNGDLVVLNAVRWAEATPDYEQAVSEYRRYVVNHEVGHALGQGHAECPEPGLPAPVMQQQTYGLDGCRRNPWPTVG